MTDAVYRNHAHYISEGWSREPKETFKALRAVVERASLPSRPAVMDVGCATGELLAYLSSHFPGGRYVGVDVAAELVSEGRRLLPAAEFVEANALALPTTFNGQFDLVTSVGCMSIFNDDQIETYWSNLLAAAKPGALVVVLSPLNEYGVDAIIRHRKRVDGALTPWEPGWSIFSLQTIEQLLMKWRVDLRFERFELPFDLPRKPDPIRTWTMKTGDRDRQLTNGLKLLVDHYFAIVRTPADHAQISP
jgi:cyclopropane fatty-acyl-phospholipid synthase-like methyltransferase